MAHHAPPFGQHQPPQLNIPLPANPPQTVYDYLQTYESVNYKALHEVDRYGVVNIPVVSTYVTLQLLREALTDAPSFY